MNLGNVLHCFFEFFPALSLCPIFWTPNRLMVVHLLVSYIPLKPSSSFSILFLSVRQFAHYPLASVVRFTDSFFWQPQSTVHPLYWLLHFSHCTFNSRISPAVFVISIDPMILLFDETWPSHLPVLVLGWFPLIFQAFFIVAVLNLLFLLSAGDIGISQIFKFPPILMLFSVEW